MDGAQEAEERKEGDLILELAIQYVQDGTYPPSLFKGKKRTVRKRNLGPLTFYVLNQQIPNGSRVNKAVCEGEIVCEAFQ